MYDGVKRFDLTSNYKDGMSISETGWYRFAYIRIPYTKSDQDFTLYPSAVEFSIKRAWNNGGTEIHIFRIVTENGRVIKMVPLIDLSNVLHVPKIRAYSKLIDGELTGLLDLYYDVDAGNMFNISIFDVFAAYSRKWYLNSLTMVDTNPTDVIGTVHEFDLKKTSFYGNDDVWPLT